MIKEYSLYELTNLIKSTLEHSLEPSYWVVAEISDLKINQKGHCYLELTDNQNGIARAKIRATIWSYSFRTIQYAFENQTGTPLKSGIKILCNVTVQYHELYGLSLNIREIDPLYTLGERERAKREVIEKLEKEGLFNKNKSLSLPMVPQRIAIISSTTAAGYGDFINQIEGNPYHYAIHHSIFEAIMQGDEAIPTIIKQLENIQKKKDLYDLIVIIRGGGSKMDLDCFDDYQLGKTIAECTIPVLTGIGHERDETIADMVAHTKLKTPTAVAEFIIQGFIQFETGLETSFRKIGIFARNNIEKQYDSIRNKRHAIQLLLKNIISKQGKKLDFLKEALQHQSNLLLHKKKHEIEIFQNTLKHLNPENILAKGYSLTTINKKVIKNPEKITKGDRIETFTSDYFIESTVNYTKKRNP